MKVCGALLVAIAETEADEILPPVRALCGPGLLKPVALATACFKPFRGRGFKLEKAILRERACC